MYRYEIVPMERLPWEGVGKGDYPELQKEMQSMFGDHWDEPTDHERAFSQNDQYRHVVDAQLRKYGFGETLTTLIADTAERAQAIPVLGRPVELEEWEDAVDAYWAGHGHCLQQSRNDPAYRNLKIPFCQVATANGRLDDGRHRLMWMRLRHRDGSGPAEILVRYHLD